MTFVFRIVFLLFGSSGVSVDPRLQPFLHDQILSDYGTNARLFPLAESTTTCGQSEAQDAQFRRVMRLQERSTSRIVDVPDDCWRRSLDFLETAVDIVHFGSISRRHSRLYDEFMLLQRTAILAHLNNTQSIISHQDMESIKREIILFPGRWCGIWKDCYDHCTFRSLQRFHVMSNRNVVCGSLWQSKRDFVSVFLRSDRSDPLGNKVLVATFDNESRLLCIATSTYFYTQIRRYGPSSIQIEHNVSDFDVKDLLMLLKRKYIKHPQLGEEVWTMESECKQKQRRKLNDMLSCIRKTCAAIPDGCAAACLCVCGGDCCPICPCVWIWLILLIVLMLPCIMCSLGIRTGPCYVYYEI